jgi:hypothetical protein
MATNTEGTIVGPNELDASEVAKLDAAASIIADCQHAQAQALYTQLKQCAHPVPTAEAGVLAKMEAEVVSLMKADPRRTRTQALEHARRANPHLERELAEAMHGRAA